MPNTPDQTPDHTPDDAPAPRPAARAELPYEDNYPEYPEETFGYGWAVWDTSSPEDIRRHDTLRAASPEALRAQDLSTLDDLARLAIAHAWRAQGRTDRSTATLRHILDGAQDHPGVCYGELYERLVYDELRAGQRPGAREMIEHLRERAGLEALASRLEGLWLALAGEEERARECQAAYVLDSEDAAEQAERCVDVAEELARFDLVDEAHRWLDEAKRNAERAGHRALGVDISLMRAQLIRAQTSAES